MASVSKVLEQKCQEAIKEDTRRIDLPHVDATTFLFFLQWLQEGKCKFAKQELLAAAWNLGAEYEIPRFQDDVMQELFLRMEKNRIDATAVQVAYKSGHDKTLLKSAFLEKLAYNFSGEGLGPWFQGDLTDSGLSGNIDFLKDFALELCAERRDLTGNVIGPVVEHFLVNK